MKIDILLGRLAGLKKTGDGKWVARCPAHQDKNPSLAVKYVEGKILLHCFAGCSTDDVLAAIGLEFDALFDAPPTHDNRARVSRHNGFNADDALLALSHECSIIGLAAGDMANGVKISPADLQRVQDASLVIAEATRFITGLHR